jgi:anti-sigma B factor antagonist
LVHQSHGQQDEGISMRESVSMQGKITIDNANEMRQILVDTISSQQGRVVVDISGVIYMDTSGLATLLEALRNAGKQGKKLVLRGIREQPRWLFEVTELDHVFEIEEIGNS